MGERPGNATLERLDTNKGYSKRHCRWMSMKDNCNNKRTCRFIEAFGLVQTAIEWAEHFEISDKAIYSRLAAGWLPGAAIATPAGARTRSQLEACHVEYGDWTEMQLGRKLFRVHPPRKVLSPRKEWQEICDRIEAFSEGRLHLLPELSRNESEATFCGGN